MRSQSIRDLHGQRLHLLNAAGAGDVHNSNQRLSLAGNHHSIRRYKRLVANARKSLLGPQIAQYFGVESHLFLAAC